eukprot:COSAG02_NODE_2370_length_9046_cov_22.705264_5_plen_430_part_00
MAGEISAGDISFGCVVEEPSFGSFAADGGFKPYLSAEMRQRQAAAAREEEEREAAAVAEAAAKAQREEARQRVAQRAAQRKEERRRVEETAQELDPEAAQNVAQRQLRALLADTSIGLTRVETYVTEVYRVSQRLKTGTLPGVEHTFYAKRCTVVDGKRVTSLLQLLRDRGVPVPNFVAPRAQWWRRGWLLQEDAEGDRLADCRAFLTDVEEVALFRSFGQTVAKMHRITMSDVVAAGLTVDPPRSWAAVHMSWIRERLAVLEGTAEFGSIVDECEAWFLERHETLFSSEVVFRLLHLDLNQNNVFATPDGTTGQPRVSAIIDWDEVCFGHAEEELMRTECASFSFDGSHADALLRKVFFEGYSSTLPLDEGYEERRPFYYLSRLLVHCGCMVELGDAYGGEADRVQGLAEIKKVLAGEDLDFRGNALL